MSCEYMNISLEEGIAEAYEQKCSPWNGRLTFSFFEYHADMLKKKVEFITTS